MKREPTKQTDWKGKVVSDIDGYLEMIPAESRAALSRLRQIIRGTAPEAEESIYYRIPTFIQNGPLVGFSATREHCSFHLMSPTLMRARADELNKYDTTTSTIHFSADAPLPEELITKLVKDRVKENEKRAKK